MVVYRISMKGRDEDSIVGDYLEDLPGELSAASLLSPVFQAAEVEGAIRQFARAATEGRISGLLTGIYLWGSKS